MHVTMMEQELRKYKEEVSTLLTDLKRTESCIESLQVPVLYFASLYMSE